MAFAQKRWSHSEKIRHGYTKKRQCEKAPHCLAAFVFMLFFYLFFLGANRRGGLFSAPISIAILARPHTNNRIMMRRER